MSMGWLGRMWTLACGSGASLRVAAAKAIVPLPSQRPTPRSRPMQAKQPSQR